MLYKVIHLKHNHNKQIMNLHHQILEYIFRLDIQVLNNYFIFQNPSQQ
jgi:hypothetical protein